ncbi:MAG: hypothetical protein WCX73_02350 [Candidatus Pacearchaeota archaeon]|jgi:hypothetical protein
MSVDKTQLIGYIAIIVIILSLASIGMKFTGFATTTDAGRVNITISSAAAINFTTDFVDFGTGSVSTGQPNATVDTEGTLTGGTGWSGANNLTLENIGNVNVSVGLKSSKLASTFIGGTNPEFKFRVINDSEHDSCVGGDAWTYTEFTLADDTVCTNFPFADDRDEIDIGIRLVVPSDSSSGTVPLTAVITATGTYS